MSHLSNRIGCPNFPVKVYHCSFSEWIFSSEENILCFFFSSVGKHSMGSFLLKETFYGIFSPEGNILWDLFSWRKHSMGSFLLKELFYGIFSPEGIILWDLFSWRNYSMGSFLLKELFYGIFFLVKKRYQSLRLASQENLLPMQGSWTPSDSC